MLLVSQAKQPQSATVAAAAARRSLQEAAAALRAQVGQREVLV
jgi:hypothetical protein